MLRCVFVLLCVFCFSSVFAQVTAPVDDPPRYIFELTVPPEIGVVLYRHLEVVRRQYDQDIDDEQLVVLADRSARQARNLLATEGFFSPQIHVRLDQSSHPPKVLMSVEPGVVTRVDTLKVSLVGVGQKAAETFYEAHRLDEKWALAPGDTFRQQAWEASKDNLLRAYRLDIFPMARLAFSEARINTEQKTAQLHVDIESGDPMMFGELRLQGLQRYPASIIHAVPNVKYGRAFSQAHLAEFQSALAAMPYFNSVTVQPLLNETQNRYVPVLVTVDEVQRRKISLGAGYSSNTGARAQFGYTDLNLRERGWQFNNLLKWEARQQSAESTMTLPRRADGWQDSFLGSQINADIQGLMTRTSTVEFKRFKEEPRIVRALTLRASYAVEEPLGSEERTTRAVVPGIDWTYRHLDSLVYPREGYVFNMQFGVAAKSFFSDQNFVRSYAKWKNYWPIGDDRDSLSLRLEAGVVLAPSREGIPQDLLFRAGGDQSIRGYRYQSIGVPEGQAVVGGRYLGVVGAEYTRWFNAQWGAGFFAEAGSAFDDSREAKFAAGLGAGPRWRSPVGPVSLDLAYGQRERRFRLHFSLGMVF